MNETMFKEQEMEAKLVYLEGLDEILITGETIIDDAVISQIVGVAAQEVEGVSSLGKASVTRSLSKIIGRKEPKSTGVETAHGKKEAAVGLTISIIYGYNIPSMVIDIRKNVAIRLFDICGLVAKEINIQISAIEFPQKALGKLE